MMKLHNQVSLISLIAILFCTCSFGQLAAKWEFDGAGTTAYDSVSSRQASIVGGAMQSGNGYVTLDGVNDYIDLSIGDVISSLNSCAIAVELDFTGDGSAWQRVFSFGSSTSEFFNLAFSNTTDNQVLIKKRHAGHDEVLFGDSYYNLTGRHHLCVVIDSAAKVTKFYIDGNLANSSIENDFVPSSLGQTSNNWIGKSQYSSGAYLKAKIYSVAIYNDAITDEQVSTMAGYNGAIAPSPADRAIAVTKNKALSWNPTGSANSYQVYLSKSYSETLNANTTSDAYKGTVTTAIFSGGNLTYDTQYYWRVDQYDSAVSEYRKGKVWSFRTAKPGDAINVMTFNIKVDSGFSSFSNPDAWNYAFGTDRKDRVINMIKTYSAFGSAGPDVVGVQEALSNQINDLKSALTDYAFYGEPRDSGITPEYCGIFYRKNRFNLVNSGTFWLSLTPDVVGSAYEGAYCARIASWVILNDTTLDRDVLIMNSHWDHVSQPARDYSATLIREKLKTIANGLPLIFMGDLNTYEDSTEYGKLMNNASGDGLELIDSFRTLYSLRHADELTCHGWKGGTAGKRIDYLICANGFAPQTATPEYLRVSDGWPSDHYPVSASFVLVQESIADIDGDNDVDYDDLAEFNRDWLKSSDYIPATEPDNGRLVAHWDFEGPYGAATAEDRVGNNDAVLMGGAVLNGQGQVDLNPVDEQYVDLGAGLGSVIGSLNSFTIVADLTWLGNEYGTWQKICNFSQNDTSTFAFITLVSTNEYYLRFQHRYDAHDEFSNAATPNLLGKHHIAVVYDPALSEFGVVKIFVDGVRVSYHTCTCDDSLAVLGNTVNNWLGKSPYPNANFFNGQIDDFRIYNSALSENDVAWLASNGNGVVIPLESRCNLYQDDSSDMEIVDLHDFSIFASEWIKYN